MRMILPILLLSLGCNESAEPLPCAARIDEVPERAGAHFDQGTPLQWESSPPATGAHYSSWAPWAQGYEQPVPRGNYVHNLEHGGVVLLYRTQGDPVAAKLLSLGRSLPQDRLCSPPINARWLLSPDPLLPEDTQVAASAWGFTYRAACLDEPSLRAFLEAHYARATEDTCADGFRTF